jgi:hypothetical protein
MLYLYENTGQEMKHNCVLGISLLSEVVASSSYEDVVWIYLARILHIVGLL